MDAITRRKFIQTNLAMWMSLGVTFGYLFVFWAMEKPAFALSNLAQLPSNVVMVLLVAYFLHHGKLIAAIYTVLPCSMLSVIGVITVAQGTVLGTHSYLLTIAVMAPILLPIQHWRGMVVLCMSNLLLFVFYQWHGWAPDPTVVTFTTHQLAMLRNSVVLSSLGLVVTMVVVSEFSAIHNETTLQNIANTDALTLLPNRRAFRNSLQRELKRSQRQRSTAAVAMIDVDFFKSINDTYGHDQGDAVLHNLAQLLLAQSRRGDTVARVGGEEFAVLMPNTSLASALTVVERMREHTSQSSLGLVDLDVLIRVSISIGLTTLQLGVAEKGVLKAADNALYQAKKTGRNRVVVHVMDGMAARS